MRRGLIFSILVMLVVYAVPAFGHGTHTVVKGDCLWTITEQLTGEPWRWTELYTANGQKIEDPNRIYPGQVFIVPDSLVAPPRELPPEDLPLVVASTVPRIWPSLLGLAIFAAVGLVSSRLRPWNWFRPGHVDEPVVQGGIQNAIHAAEILRSQAAEASDGLDPVTVPLVRLREVRIFGTIEVAGADGEFRTRVCKGDIGWEGIFEDGSRRYTLAACGNPLRIGRGGRLLSGYVRGLEEVPVPPPVVVPPRPAPQVVKPEPEVVVEPESVKPEPTPQVQVVAEVESGAPERSMMYPFHPCVVGRNMRMLRLAAAVRGGGLRRR